jgi:hypothetical protein
MAAAHRDLRLHRILQHVEWARTSIRRTRSREML